MPKLENVVVASKSRDGRSIKIDDQWYKAFNSSQLSDVEWKDTINLTYNTREKAGVTYYNIQGAPEIIEKANGGGSPAPSSGGNSTPRVPDGFPIPPTHHSRSIVRQNSVTNAVNLFVNTNDSIEGLADLDGVCEEILTIARKFEEYSCGDIERRAAEAVMSSVND